MLPEIITKLKALSGAGGDDVNDEYWEIDEILDAYKPDGYSTEVVEESFEDGGRWSNYRTQVYKVEQSGVTAYFELWREVPATEMQEGQDCMWGFNEVLPVEKTVIVYE